MKLYVVKSERVLCLDWWVGITKWMRFLFPCGFWQTNHLSEYIGCSRTKASIMIISLYYWTARVGSMFQRIHLDTYLQYLCLVCRYAEFAQYEADSEGVDHSLTLVHHLGQKWSLFLKDWIAQGMKTTTGISPHIDITKNLLVVRFKERCW